MSDIDWAPGASLAALRERAWLNARIRQFFAERQVLEVETPLLCAYGASEPHLAAFRIAGGSECGTTGRDAGRFLQTSPEYAMKRLLAAGSGPIYQLGKAFRAGDAGRRHNPEFTLLEWYRPGWSLPGLMDEVEALLTSLLAGSNAALSMEGAGAAACDRVSYRALFESALGFNPHDASGERLRDCVRDLTSFGDASALDRAACLDLLFAQIIEPSLGAERPSFVFDFPVAQASLARVRETAEGDHVAARCEVYLGGMELANAYDELADAAEFRRRGEADNQCRLRLGLAPMPVDSRLESALAAGLPACAGVALGVDRLLMLRLGVRSIDDVLSFSFGRA